MMVVTVRDPEVLSNLHPLRAALFPSIQGIKDWLRNVRCHLRVLRRHRISTGTSPSSIKQNG